MTCRLGTPPSEVEEWTAGVSVHYRTGTFLCCVTFWVVCSYLWLWMLLLLHDLDFRIGLYCFEDSTEFPLCIRYFSFSHALKRFEFSPLFVPCWKGPVKLLSG